MIEITNSTVVNRPVDEVFALAGNPTQDDRWATVMIETRQTSDGPIGTGTTLVQVLQFLGKKIPAECEITEYEPNRRIAFTMVSGINDGAHERTFEPVDGGTRVTLLTRGDSSGVFKIADPLLKRLATRQMAADLEILKELLESGVDPAELG